MKLKLIFSSIMMVFFLSTSFGQSKMIYGKKHLVFAEIPKNWSQMPIEQAPFFIKPDKKDVDNKTYMYIIGIDYSINPDLNGWIEANSEELKSNFKDLKIDSLTLELNNLKEGEYVTGRYKFITHEYEDKRKEVLLVVECKNSIITIVMSAVDRKEFDANFDAYKELAASLKIMGATVVSKD